MQFCGSIQLSTTQYLGLEHSKKRKREINDDLENGSIPRPGGSAGKGKGKGYNLQKEMGLDGTQNSQIFLSLQVCVIIGLPHRN